MSRIHLKTSEYWDLEYCPSLQTQFWRLGKMRKRWNSWINKMIINQHFLSELHYWKSLKIVPRRSKKEFLLYQNLKFSSIAVFILTKFQYWKCESFWSIPYGPSNSPPPPPPLRWDSRVFIIIRGIDSIVTFSCYAPLEHQKRAKQKRSEKCCV